MTSIEQSRTRAGDPVAEPDTQSTAASQVVVDVGIPTLGTSPYLTETIESVLGQTMSAWRLVISENGPGSDTTRGLLAPYLEDPRVHHTVTGERLGPGANHTRLIRAGTAPYVGVLHDDDRWGPRFLESRVEFLESHPTCGFVFSGHVLIDDKGLPTGRSRPEFPEGVYASEYILPRLYDRNFIAPPAVLARRSAYAATGSGYKDVLFCDHEMWLRLAAFFDVGCLDDDDVEYRLHPIQTSSKRRLELAQYQFEVIEASSDLPIPRSLRRHVLARTHARCALDLVELGERRQALGRLRMAVQSDPWSVVRPDVAARIAVALAAMSLGERGRQALARERMRRYVERGSERLS